jgi:hypothetical protein
MDWGGLPGGKATLGFVGEPGFVGRPGLAPWLGSPFVKGPALPGLITGGGDRIAGGGGDIAFIGLGESMPGSAGCPVGGDAPPIAAFAGPWVKTPISGLGGAGSVCLAPFPA